VWKQEIVSVAKKYRIRNHACLDNRIVIRPRIEEAWKSPDVIGCHYNLPSQVLETYFELVYVDGPTAWPQTDLASTLSQYDPEGNYLPNLDVAKLIRPKIILINGRRATLKWLIE
jgi:hypothetical protein